MQPVTTLIPRIAVEWVVRDQPQTERIEGCFVERIGAVIRLALVVDSIAVGVDRDSLGAAFSREQAEPENQSKDGQARADREKRDGGR
jgi:hypothetical protein